MLRNGLEPWHLLIVAIVIILLFGSKKLPDMARSLGKSMRILKSETRAMKSDGAPEADVPSADDASAQPTAQRVIQTAPGDSDTARPVTQTKVAD
ncbi:Sec-independent protein translocase subunit TatA [Streptomyces sp. NPDC046821]|uniref:Sec-independent protein translocase subunit TatA n=1 Tax=Streptomyces sp. NPDC046821 TaxID=3154702 RepID=UPI0033C724AD